MSSAFWSAIALPSTINDMDDFLGIGQALES